MPWATRIVVIMSSVEDTQLRALVSDLEMSFGKVEVIHETQFMNAGLVAGLTHELIDKLSKQIGLKTAVNHELPAIIVIEKIKDSIKGMDISESPKEFNTDKPMISSPPESVLENSPNMTTETSQVPHDSSVKINSFIDMSMIKIIPNGYAGNFLDRHLVYSIEDQNRVINLERGTRTCQVLRRFSDFVAVREYLLTKYPFKCVPRLPAKRVQMFSDESFLLDRQKSLRRFLGIISRHHVYKTDPLIQAFIYNQKEYSNLISDQKFISPDREHMLLTQIPSADALVRANVREAINSIEKSRAEAQKLVSFCTQTREQIKILIDTTNRESTCLTKLSSILIKSEDVTGCLCPSKCRNCTEEESMRKHLSSKLTSVNGTTETNTIIEFEEIIEKLNLLIDLFESFNELVSRSDSLKFSNFEEIGKEIGLLEVEIEKKRASGDEEYASIIERLQHRIDALKQEWDEQDTFNKFIQFSMYDEMRWVHGHKTMIKQLLDHVAFTITLKQRQWIATFDS